MSSQKCPDCDANVEVPTEVLIGEIISCPDCGLEFEVTKVSGPDVELKVLVLEKEDWGE